MTATSARLLLSLGILIFATCCWLSAFNPSLVYPDAYDYVQMGREIARGNGFSSQQIFPRHIPFLAEHGHWSTPPWPNLHRYPVTPALIATTMLFIDDPVYAAVIQSGIWFILSALLVFVLASRFTNLAVAFFCALIFIAEPDLFESGHAGMTESFATLIILGFFLTIHSRSDTKWRWLIVGMICGIGCLTRTQLFVLLPVGMGYLCSSSAAKHRIKSISLFFLGALIVVSPWMIRNVDVTEDPFFSFSTSRNLIMQSHSLGQIDIDSDIALDLNASPYILDLARNNSKLILSQFARNLGKAFLLDFWPEMFDKRFAIFLLLLPIAVISAIKSQDEEYRLFHYLEAV